MKKTPKREYTIKFKDLAVNRVEDGQIAGAGEGFFGFLLLASIRALTRPQPWRPEISLFLTQRTYQAPSKRSLLDRASHSPFIAHSFSELFSPAKNKDPAKIDGVCQRAEAGFVCLFYFGTTQSAKRQANSILFCHPWS